MRTRAVPLSLVGLGLAALTAVSCHAPSLIAPPAPAWDPALPAAELVAALAAKPNSNWQDATLTHPALMARRKAQRYKTQATALGGPVWTATLPAVSTSAPAYSHLDLNHPGPNPAAGEAVFAATEAAAETPQIFKLDATTGAVLNGTGWDALTGLAAPGTIQRSAVTLSGDNRRLYLLTSGGYVIVLDAATGARTYSRKISNSGFAGCALFIDYSNGGGYPAIGSDENLCAVSADGSVYRINVLNGTPTVTAFPSSNGTDRNLAAWAGRPQIPYGAAVTINAFPIAWNAQVFFGSTAGRAYRVDISGATPVLTTWRPDQHTSAPYTGITAPPAIDFDANFAVSMMFVPCGDRLAWIDTTKSPVEDAVVVSPPLLIDAKTPTQGRLSTYTYSSTALKGPYDCLDYISISQNANPTPTRWGGANNGADSRLFGAAGYDTPGDGNQSRGYMQFEIPVDDYAGATPVGARIELSAGLGAPTTETVQVYRASNYRLGTNQYWTGYCYTPDIDRTNRPELLSGVIGQFSGLVTTSANNGTPRYSVNFTDQFPSDQANVGTRAWYSYAMVSAGKQRDAAPAATAAAQWVKAVVGTNNTEPRLYVTVANGANMPAGQGLRSQPTLDSAGRKVWVAGANALFELDYATSAAFQSKASTLYNLTASGRGTLGAPGPTTTVAPKTYLMPKANVLYTGSRVIVADTDPTNNRFFMNDFAPPLAAATDKLGFTYDAGAGAVQVGEQMLWDFAGGSAYMTTRNNRLVRVDIQ